MRVLVKATWVELKLFFREPLTVVFALALPVGLMWLLSGVFSSQPDPHIFRGVGAMNYYLPTYVSVVLASLGLIGLPTHLAGYRERGVLRRFRASAVPLTDVFAAQVVVVFAIAVLGSLLVGGVAAITHDIAVPKWLLGVAAAFALSALTFGALGTLLGLVMPTARAAQGLGVLLWFIMIFTGGAGPPPEVLTGSMRTASGVVPLHYVIVLMQDAWLGLGWNRTNMLVLMGFLIVSALLALRIVRRA